MIERNGQIVPNCATCLCPCVVGEFTHKNIQGIAIAYEEKKALQSRKEGDRDPKKQTFNNLGTMLSAAVVDGVQKCLSCNNGSASASSANMFSVTVEELSKKDIDKDHHHSLQSVFPEPTNKLNSRKDIRTILQQGRNDKR